MNSNIIKMFGAVLALLGGTPVLADEVTCPTAVLEAQTQGRVCAAEGLLAAAAAKDAAQKCLVPTLPPSPECVEAMKKAEKAGADLAKCIGTAVQGCTIGVDKVCRALTGQSVPGAD